VTHIRSVPVLAIVGLMLATTVGLAQRVAPPPVEDLLANAAAYVEQFEKDFAFVVSDEDYQQRIGIRPIGMLPPDKVRITRAEVVFLWLPHEQLWLTARNVRTLNGKNVAGSETAVQEALADDGGRVARLRQLRAQSARYNIGPMLRNFNDPTLTLQFVGARLQSRFSWAVEERETIDGHQTWRLKFTERQRPSLIRRGTEELPATGRMWVEASSGRIHKTRLDVTDKELRARAILDVTFERDDRLGMLVPNRMEENYEQEQSAGLGVITRRGPSEPIKAVATYSNFRRFETSGRLITR
jgi:hypothetical protein